MSRGIMLNFLPVGNYFADRRLVVRFRPSLPVLNAVLAWRWLKFAFGRSRRASGRRLNAGRPRRGEPRRREIIANKKRKWYAGCAMSLRLCRVVVSDLEGVMHTVEVTASTLYEAVALGLSAIRKQEWAAETPHGLNTVDVRVSAVAMTHSVKMLDFHRWLDRKGGSPREIALRNHLRMILGLRDRQSRSEV